MGSPEKVDHTSRSWPYHQDLPEWKNVEANFPEKPYACMLDKHMSKHPYSPKWMVQSARDNGHAYNLLSRLLRMDPNRRITAADALRHPYFNDVPRHNEGSIFQAGMRDPYPVRQPKPYPAPAEPTPPLPAGKKADIGERDTKRQKV